ncbi:hypothetical protein L9F63_022460 [Diploptera punctata]|uniref:Alpha-carbonic anhydrase domain-containing protein n=1 Tax=Diploptera punctata TaxID=6984 RepID=A0AAD7ZLX0_DIPPU|nr:hypothetical protein L9F63_022460 [Diploptera punctata]
MTHFNVMEFLVVCTCIILMAFLLTEILDWTQLFSCAEYQKPIIIINYGYTSHNGPQTWQNQFPEFVGNNQSPINIETTQAIVMNCSEPLVWQNYDINPIIMNVTNDGHTVVVTGVWEDTPKLSGGPLGTEEYEFHSLIFHWGPCDAEGSEHSLDNSRYAMELQMVHVKKGYSSTMDVVDSKDKEGIAIISFFFQIAPVDNPLLDSIVNNLFLIAQPGSTSVIPQFPLNQVYPPFENKYYTYNGSLTQPPCYESVIWIIQPEGLAVSSRQMNQFRMLYSEDGRMCSNLRPVQPLNDRDILYYD